MAFTEPVAGDEISEPFTGNIRFDDVSVQRLRTAEQSRHEADGGHPGDRPVKITNNGAAPEGFFVDPRLNASASITLAA